MLPLFVRQGIFLVIRQSEITTSCGIGQRRRYLVDCGRSSALVAARPGRAGQVHVPAPAALAAIPPDVGKIVPLQPFTLPAGR
jgi:hypothetical protein